MNRREYLQEADIPVCFVSIKTYLIDFLTGKLKNIDGYVCLEINNKITYIIKIEKGEGNDYTENQQSSCGSGRLKHHFSGCEKAWNFYSNILL